MTSVMIEQSKTGYKSLTFMGHSGKRHFFFEKDMVCASISVLVINTINSIEKFTDTVMEVSTNEETGFIRVVFEGVLSSEATVLVDAMIFGLEQISLQYSRKYCKVEFKEV